MIKLLVILSLIFIGCTQQAPTQGQIDRAAAKILRERMACALIAVYLNGKGTIKQDSDGPFCEVVLNKKVRMPPYRFGTEEMEAISRYISIQNEEVKK